MEMRSNVREAKHHFEETERDVMHCVLTKTSLDPIVLVLVELIPLLHSLLSH